MKNTTKLDETQDFVDLFEYVGGGWVVPSVFLRWAALSLLAAVVEDRVFVRVFEHAPLYPNIWVFLIGDSGCGKDYAIGLALSLLPPNHTLWKIDGKVTMPALYDYLQRQQRLTGRDSAPAYLVSSDVTEQLPLGVEAKEFTSRVLQLYGGRERQLFDLTRTSGDRYIQRPLLNWIAGCTREWFPHAIDATVFNAGFAGRAFFILGEPQLEHFSEITPPRRRDHDAVMEHLRARVEFFFELHAEATMSERARLFYQQWLENQRMHLQNAQLTEVERAVVNRQRTTVLKLATLYAISAWVPGKSLTIRGNHINRAIDDMRVLLRAVLEVANFAYQTPDTVLVDRVRDIIRTAGVIPRQRCLDLAVRRGVKSHKTFDEIIETLVQAGIVEIRRPPKEDRR